MELHISFYKDTGKLYTGGSIVLDDMMCSGNMVTRQKIYDKQNLVSHPEQFFMVVENHNFTNGVLPNGKEQPFFFRLFMPVALQPREEKNLQNRVRRNTK